MTDTDVFVNGSHGAQIIGNTNQIFKADAGDKGKGNGGDGVNSWHGNRFRDRRFANKGWASCSPEPARTSTRNTAGDKGDKANGKGGFPAEPAAGSDLEHRDRQLSALNVLDASSS